MPGRYRPLMFSLCACACRIISSAIHRRRQPLDIVNAGELGFAWICRPGRWRRADGGFSQAAAVTVDDGTAN